MSKNRSTQTAVGVWVGSGTALGVAIGAAIGAVMSKRAKGDSHENDT